MAGAIEQTVILNSSIGDNRTSVGENLVILSTFTFPFIISGCGLAGGGSVPQTETPLPISTSSPTTVPTEEPTRTPDPDLTTPAYCATVGDSETITATVPKALKGSGETAQTVGDWFLSLNTAGNIYTADAGDVLNGATGNVNFTYVNSKSVICLSKNQTSAAIHAASAAPIKIQP